MTTEQVKSLLEKYWDGDTSTEEERQLKTYFQSGNVDDSLRNIAPLFQAIREEQAVIYGQPLRKASGFQGFRWNIFSMAASVALLLSAGLWLLLRSTPDAPPSVALAQPPVVQPRVETVTTVPAPPKPKSVRAFFHKRKPVAEPDESVEDPQVAYETIRAALALVSNKLNKGKKEATKNLDKIETIDRFFKKKPETAG